MGFGLCQQIDGAAAYSKKRLGHRHPSSSVTTGRSIMNPLTPFEPRSSLTTPFERMDDLFSDMFRRFIRTPAWPRTVATSEMSVDVSEDDKQYFVKAELPGVKKDDIRVSIDGNVVSIGAEVKEEKEEKQGERTLMRERY